MGGGRATAKGEVPVALLLSVAPRCLPVALLLLPVAPTFCPGRKCKLIHGHIVSHSLGQIRDLMLGLTRCLAFIRDRSRTE